MEFGVTFPSKIGAHDLVVLAEDLGYDQAWFYDSQMIYSDVYATMALAAYRTSRIRLGTAVAVPTTRMAPTIAHSIATINQLAPGRVDFGFGVGNTALLTMGLPPVRFSKFREDARLIRTLLNGGTARLREGDRETNVRFLHPDRGYINLSDPIPIYLSAFQPKGVALCGAEFDGHIVFGLPPGAVEIYRGMVAKAARDAGRASTTLPTKGIYPTAILEPGESSASPRVLEAVAPFVTNAYHFMVEWGTAPVTIPPEAEPLLERYKESVAALPKDERHLILHEGHLIYAREEEKEFVTAAKAEVAANIGTPEEIIERIRTLEAAGLSHYSIQVTDVTDAARGPHQQIREFADLVMKPYRSLR